MLIKKEDDTEQFGFFWPGKKEAKHIAAAPSAGTLVPVHGDGVDEETSRNIYIEGDNLEVLKLLNETYTGKIKMIYIDPPYNTGNDYVYSDKFGKFHFMWCSMMYPRLYLARKLLNENGVIFISIDDNELAHLRKICDEIFGEENFVAIVPRIAKRTSDKGTHFKPTKDYLVCFAKNLPMLSPFGIAKIRDEKKYDMIDKDGRRYKKSGASLYQPSLDSRPNQRYYIQAPDGSLIIPPGNVFPDKKEDTAKVKPLSNADKVWRWSADTYLKQKHLLIFTKGSSQNPLLDENGKQSKWNIYPKVFFDDDAAAKLHPEDVIYDFPNSQAAKELKSLGIPFDFAKPSGLIKYLISLIDDKEMTVLDFFCGSATTAHAVMKQNVQDSGNRRFIMVQIPEICKEGSEAAQSGYKNICEIGKERIRRAGKKIREEIGSLAKGIDTGFKVFRFVPSQ
ncbi:MAG: site-specific DNA-methyltransferase [Treponema sp.]|nr:site-specific DNA-methyltransferase [Treponema sp.]